MFIYDEDNFALCWGDCESPMTYQDVKRKLKERGVKISYFTHDFYSTYRADARAAALNFIKDVAETEYVATMQTKFYTDNSTAYCTFLEVMEAAKQKYRAELYRNGVYVASKGFTAEDDVLAEGIAQRIMERYECDGVEVAKEEA